MKKLLFVLLATSATIALTACKNDSTDDISTDADQTQMDNNDQMDDMDDGGTYEDTSSMNGNGGTGSGQMNDTL